MGTIPGKLSMIAAAAAISAGLLSGGAAGAADDPIEVRQGLMQGVGGAAGAAGKMLKGEIAYEPAVGKAVIAAMNASALAFGDYFPEGSGEGDTDAKPEIWQDMAGFQEQIDMFLADTAAGVEAAGKNGPADLDAFKAAMGPIFENCKDCHEDWRKKN